MPAKSAPSFERSTLDKPDIRKPCAVPSSSVKKRLSGGFSCIGANQRWEARLEEGTQRYLAD